MHAEGGPLHLEGGWPAAEIAELEAHWDVVRWGARNLYFGGRAGGRARRGRGHHGGRRSTARRGRGGRRVIRIRRAEPADAVSLVELAEAVGGEEGRWILATDTWRSVSEERRYLKTVLRHPDATVIVALDGEHVVGRLSLSRDPHPASHHVADLGLMVAESHRRRGIGKRLLEEAVTWARGVGNSQARAPRLSLERECAPPVRVVRVRARGLPQAALRPRRRARRRRPDGPRGS